MVTIVNIIAPKLELGKKIQIVLGRADCLMAFFYAFSFIYVSYLQHSKLPPW